MTTLDITAMARKQQGSAILSFVASTIIALAIMAFAAVAFWMACVCH